MLRTIGMQFEAAAQAWNHNFYWKSLHPEHHEGLEAAIPEAFGGFADLRERVIDTATRHFGSGYLWLYRDPAGL